MLMDGYYPLMLHLNGRSCLVVGGGKVAARKVEGLLQAGALVTVISPTLCSALHAHIDSITFRQQLYTSELLGELRPLLVFAATDDAAVNARIVADARAQNMLVNGADDEGDFMNMAVVRRGNITIGISTGGASPALAAHLRERLEAVIGEEYAVLAQWLGEARAQIRERIASQSQRAALWQAVIDSDVLDQLRNGNIEAARMIFEKIVKGSS
jgi:precorrin-2 dehydrogenase/sirohydrochlorin ferrochelatase